MDVKKIVRCLPEQYQELLEWVGQPLVTSGNENVDVLQVEFGPEWEFPGARYFASFFIDDPEKTVDIELDKDHSCPIPKQMLAQEQTFHFGVWAQADGQKIKSSENKDYYVKQGAKGTNNAGAFSISPEYWYERNEEVWT